VTYNKTNEFAMILKPNMYRENPDETIRRDNPHGSRNFQNYFYVLLKKGYHDAIWEEERSRYFSDCRYRFGIMDPRHNTPNHHPHHLYTLREYLNDDPERASKNFRPFSEE